MVGKRNICKHHLLSLALILLTASAHAQLTTGVTGLLHMPTAEMQQSGTFMAGANYLDKHNLPNRSHWDYNSYNYFVNLTLFERVEIAYICTLVKGKPNTSYWPPQTWNKFVNQDRHFAARIQPIKEGEWWKHMPALVLGMSDPTTGGTGNDYTNMDIKGDHNGFFNRYYIALSKHLPTPVGRLGIHAAYLYNFRTDYPLNGPALGLSFNPALYPPLSLMAEYDSKTVNVGALLSVWHDHFNLVMELQKFRYPSVGITYKVNLAGGNDWSF